MKTPKEIALFDIDEIEIGEKLGSGGYNVVHEIAGFCPKQDRIMNKNRRLKRDHQEAREFLRKHATRRETGELRYAIKHVKESLLNDRERFECGAMDLELEAEILSTLDHPNILKIRGWATNGYDSYFKLHRHDAYFLIVDRLTETLTDRIESWKKQLTNAAEDPVTEEKIAEEVLLDQLKVASDIAKALEYLHGKGIIYRDLKPDNIGFDIHGELKVFDFGLARKLPKHRSTDEVFEMSGRVGTARYMAPEVALCKSYNAKADVYSFAHVLWEILSLTQPYAFHTKASHKDQVIRKGERPTLEGFDSSLRVKNLLSKAWHADLNERPSMRVLRTLLMHEIAEKKGLDCRQYEQEVRRQPMQKRRSTHVELTEQIKKLDTVHPKLKLGRATRRSSLVSRAA